MKIFSTRLLAAGLAMTMASGFQALADFDDGNFTFRPISGEACVVMPHFPYYSGDVVIPAKATDSTTDITYTVTGIASLAFQDCADMKSVTFPQTIEVIDARAFRYCTGLTTVTLPASLKEISFHVFSYCTNLEAINVEEGNQYYKSIDGILYDKSGETLVMSPEMVTEVNVPEGVKEIGYGAFYNNTLLETVVLSEGVERISTGAFQQCEGLVNINIPATVEYIGGWAFDHCYSLEEFNCGAGLKEIDSAAFQYCTSLDTFVASDALESLGESAFMGASSLRSVYLGKSFQVLGWNSLSSCENLKEIIVLAPTAPEADETDFTEDQYANVILYIAEDYVSEYDDAYPWNLFQNIRPYKTGVTAPEANSEFEVSVCNGVVNATSEGEILLFTADGKLLGRSVRALHATPGKGLYIIKSGPDSRKILL